MVDFEKAGEMEGQAPSVLSGYITRDALAVELRCSKRTIARYELLPDGLPSVIIAGRKYYSVATVRQWLSAREHRPNPLRRH